MITWSLQKRNIKDLKKHPKNPRTISKDQYKLLVDSIEKFGLAEKPTINLDNTIIGGHQRIEVMRKAGIKEIDCWVPEIPLNEKDEEELLLKLNRIHGDFDWEVLANNFEVPDLLDYGFTVQEMELVLDEKPSDETKKGKKQKECPSCGHKF